MKKVSGTKKIKTINEPPTEQPAMPDFTNPIVAFNLIGSMVNKANQRGVYELSESAMVFQCLQTIGTYINTTVVKK
tara:strand:- start:467 stop:694 length:228 start_codon:yes stop_codon:yes gene_type:complete